MAGHLILTSPILILKRRYADMESLQKECERQVFTDTISFRGCVSRHMAQLCSDSLFNCLLDMLANKC